MFTLFALLAVMPALLVSAQGPRPKAILGCTTSSFEMPSWFIHDFQYSSTANSTSGTTSFHLLNRVTNDTADLTCQTGKAGGWNECAIKNGWNKTADGSLHASVQLSATTANLALNQTWTCSDRKNIAPYAKDLAISPTPVATGSKNSLGERTELTVWLGLCSSRRETAQWH